MSLEAFRPIPGYGDRYEVSSWGRVLDIWSCQFVRPEVTKKGYLRVALFDEDDKRHWQKVHRLVASAFIGNPDNKPEVNHIDGNKQNNSFTNLEWVTGEENRESAKQLAVMQKSIPFDDAVFKATEILKREGNEHPVVMFL